MSGVWAAQGNIGIDKVSYLEGKFTEAIPKG
jgi:hypothetical protein